VRLLAEPFDLAPEPEGHPPLVRVVGEGAHP
jgi:hypothetical protein